MTAGIHRKVLALPEAGFVTHAASEALNPPENQGVARFILKLQERRLDGLVAPATVCARKRGKTPTVSTCPQ
jgi:hypothetical protein